MTLAGAPPAAVVGQAGGVPTRGNSLIAILVARGLASEDACRRAIASARHGEPLRQALVRAGAVGERDLAVALAEASRTPLVSLEPYPEVASPIEPAEQRLAAQRMVDPVSPDAARLLPRELCERHRMVLVATRGHDGILAMADPFDAAALREASARTGLHIKRVTADPAGIRSALERAGTGSPLPVLAPTIRVARFAVTAVVVYLVGLCIGFLWTMRESLNVEHFIALIALACGLVFFLYALRYYVAAAIVVGAVVLGRSPIWARLRPAKPAGEEYEMLLSDPAAGWIKPERQPFVSVQLALYNEERVVDRLLKACTSLDYDAYEVIVADDSNDGTAAILERWKDHPRVRILHRETRAGFKGGALQEALKRMDPRTEHVVIFDADFVPPPDVIWRFLERMGSAPDDVAAVQGYQWHMLNASENWLTRAIRAEFSGSYVVERSAQEILGAMKMISGSVYMIRADVLRRLGWSTSITEDWELTIRLYLAGYRVLYTPYVQAAAECVSRIPQLIRQRERWARGHTYNVRKYILPILRSTRLGWREKIEFLFYAPYYLQSVVFMIGTLCWIVGVLLMGQELPGWGAILGWSLVVSNVLALPLMNATGLALEGTLRRDALGLLGQVALSILLVPFQATAALRGLLEPAEGTWVRTPKSGRVTERAERFRLPRMRHWDLPHPGLRVGGWGWAGAAAAVVLVGALTVRAASAASLSLELLLVPLGIGAVLPIGIVTAGRRRPGWPILGLLLAVTANVVFLAAAMPADAAAGTGNVFYFRGTTAFSCAGRDMTQTASTSGTTRTIPGVNGQVVTFCSDTFATGMSLSGGTAVATLWTTNSASTSCTLTATLLHNATVLGSGVVIVPARTRTVTQFTSSFAALPVAFSDGDRLSLRLGWAAASCQRTDLSYDSSSRPSRVASATIVPEAALPLLLAPLVPLAIRRLARSRR